MNRKPPEKMRFNCDKTHPKFNSSTLKHGRSSPKGKDRLPTLHFQGQSVKLRGVICGFSYGSLLSWGLEIFLLKNLGSRAIRFTCFMGNGTILPENDRNPQVYQTSTEFGVDDYPLTKGKTLGVQNSIAHIDLCAKNRPGKSSKSFSRQKTLAMKNIRRQPFKKRNWENLMFDKFMDDWYEGLWWTPNLPAFIKAKRLHTWRTHQDKQQKNNTTFLFMNCWHRFIGLNFSPKTKGSYFFLLLHTRSLTVRPWKVVIPRGNDRLPTTNDRSWTNDRSLQVSVSPPLFYGSKTLSVLPLVELQGRCLLVGWFRCGDRFAVGQVRLKSYPRLKEFDV